MKPGVCAQHMSNWVTLKRAWVFVVLFADFHVHYILKRNRCLQYTTYFSMHVCVSMAIRDTPRHHEFHIWCPVDKFCLYILLTFPYQIHFKYWQDSYCTATFTQWFLWSFEWSPLRMQVHKIVQNNSRVKRRSQWCPWRAGVFCGFGFSCNWNAAQNAFGCTICG